MSSISSIASTQTYSITAGASQQCSVLKEETIQKLLALGIDPSTVTSESQAQLLIAQTEAAKNKENNPEQEEGGNQQEKHKAELLQQNIFNTMDMISLSNKLILGL